MHYTQKAGPRGSGYADQQLLAAATQRAVPVAGRRRRRGRALAARVRLVRRSDAQTALAVVVETNGLVRPASNFASLPPQILLQCSVAAHLMPLLLPLPPPPPLPLPPPPPLPPPLPLRRRLFARSCCLSACSAVESSCSAAESFCFVSSSWAAWSSVFFLLRPL